jgi:hypothetical protein
LSVSKSAGAKCKEKTIHNPFGTIEGSELLKHPHRVGSTQYRNRTREADRLGTGGCGRQDDCWRRVQKFGAVVFAHAEDVEPKRSASSISSRRSAMRSVAEGGLPVLGSGRIAAKLSTPISIVFLLLIAFVVKASLLAKSIR